MEIYFNEKEFGLFENEPIALMAKKKIDEKEWVARKALYKAWVRLLEFYSRPGVAVPSAQDLKREVYHVGVDAAAKAIAKKFFWITEKQAKKEVKKQIAERLDSHDFNEFRKALLEAQEGPYVLQALKERLERELLHPPA